MPEILSEVLTMGSRVMVVVVAAAVQGMLQGLIKVFEHSKSLKAANNIGNS